MTRISRSPWLFPLGGLGVVGLGAYLASSSRPTLPTAATGLPVTATATMVAALAFIALPRSAIATAILPFALATLAALVALVALTTLARLAAWAVLVATALTLLG